MAAWPISGLESERIQNLVRKLKKNDPLRDIAHALLADQELPPGSAVALLNTLAQPKSRASARAIAAWSLGLAALTDEERASAQGHLSALLGVRPTHSVGCLVAASLLCSYLLIFLVPIYAAQDRGTNQARELAALSLGRLGSRQSVEPLVDAVTQLKGGTAFGDKQVRFAAAFSLQILLQQLPYGGLNALDEAGVRSVAQLLREHPEPRHMAVLAVLKAAGTSLAIPAVEKFAKKDINPQLKQAAQETLAVLQERQVVDRQRASLLRPADELPSDSTRLLRVTDKAASDPTLLLRADSSIDPTERTTEIPEITQPLTLTDHHPGEPEHEL